MLGLDLDPGRAGGDVVGMHGADRLVGRDVLAVATERSVRRDLTVEPAGPQVVDELIEVGVGHTEAVAVVDLQRRRLGAGRLALGVLQRDQPVARWCCRP